MNIADNPHQFDFSKVAHLFEGQLGFVEETPRDYQIQILRDTVRDMSQGFVEGRWDIATAGGKSAMAHTLCQHLVMRGGRTLYLTAGNNELRNAVRSHKKYGLGKDHLQVKGEEGIEKLLQNTHPYIYATTQMLTHDCRYKNIDPEYFDLIIIDESQDFFGDIFSLPLFHFNCPKIYASATPFTITYHLGARVPHVYGEVTSKELEEKHGFPKKKIRSYYIQDSHDKNSQNTIGSDFDFDSEKSHRLLNIGRRFTLLEGILEEVIQKGGKILPFMTSVRDAENFVRLVVPFNPILRGKVDFTAGVRGTDKNNELEQQLREGHIRALLSKDIINTALDIPDITDVVFTAPSLSLQKMIQRIGRAARPHDGKEYYTIHDMISSVFHSGKHQGKNKAIRTSQLHRLENDNKKKFLGKLAENQTYYDVVLPEGTSGKEGFSYTEVEMGEIEHLIFLGDKQITLDIYATFARDIFGVSYKELFDNIEIYRDQGEAVTIDWRGNQFPITFQELITASEFFGTFDYCREYDYLGELYEAIKNGGDQDITPLLSRRNNALSKDRDIEIFTPSLEEQRSQILEGLLTDRGVNVEVSETNFQIVFSEEIIQTFESMLSKVSQDSIRKTRSILAGEVPEEKDEEMYRDISIKISGEQDMETMILSFISQLPDPHDMFVCEQFIIEVCQILTLHFKNKLTEDFKFSMNPQLGTKFLAIINPGASENLRDKDFNVVKVAKENDVFLSKDTDIFYVMSHAGFINAYKLVRDVEGNEYYLCLNDNAVEVMRIGDSPKYGILQSIRFFDKQGENAIPLDRMFPDVKKIRICPGENNPHKEKASITGNRIGGKFYWGKNDTHPALQIYDHDKVVIQGYQPHFFYPSK